MKKKLHAVLCPLLAAGICLSVAACGGGTDSSSSAPEEDYPELDLAHAFTDDFNSVDRSYWSIMNTRWGGESHGGVIRETWGIRRTAISSSRRTAIITTARRRMFWDG